MEHAEDLIIKKTCHVPRQAIYVQRKKKLPQRVLTV
jgi:hypothetical protein